MRHGRFGFLVAGLSALLLAPAVSAAPPSPPGQPATGPGGSAYAHAGVRTSGPFFAAWDDLANLYTLYEPASPAPATAPVVLFLHGYGAVKAAPYLGWIEHMVRMGYVVVWVRYQGTGLTGLPWTFPANAVRAFTEALALLRTGSHVRPEEDASGVVKSAFVGHSLGAYLSAALAARSADPESGIAPPHAVVAIEPGGNALFPSDDLSTIPAGTKLVVVAGDDDRIVCIAGAVGVWEATTQIPDQNRDFLLVLSDRYGAPAQVADHFFPAAHLARQATIDNRDFSVTWKLSVAALDCAFKGTNCSAALGDGAPEQVGMGVWSDGTPVTPLMWVEDPTQLQATCQQ